MVQVRKAVVLAAGLGTRMLPATKAIPKEMLPVVDKPLIQYAVEEACGAGLSTIIFVVAEGKQAIADHFGHTTRVEAFAREQRDQGLLDLVQEPSKLAQFAYVLQDAPRGIAHAVACAREYLEGEPFALIFPDDLIVSERPCLAQMIEAYQGSGSMIAVQEVATEDVPQYGIVDPEGGGNPVRLKGIVEKPRPEEAPSRLGVVGRYIIGPSIFEHIDRIVPGKNGELQITDALAGQIAAGEPVTAFTYEGTRFDTGRPVGYLTANIAVALGRQDIAPALRQRLAALDAQRVD
ncbi:MAG TPA: UTP--glucose-1-phosphate uridylyltransferase [Tepidiformaceae bacterium]|nr:UTP--glucose-1-phosphate uridylyltransferase [Tepidiformaceae bacterium]